MSRDAGIGQEVYGAPVETWAPEPKFTYFTASDGQRLIVVEIGPPGAPSLLLVNAFATPVLAHWKMLTQLATTYRIISWESRLAPYLDNEQPATVGIERFAEDLKEVTAQFARDVKVVIAFCSGAAVVAWAASSWSIAPSQIILISPSSVVPSRATTDYETEFADLMNMVATCPEEDTEALVDAICAVNHQSNELETGADSFRGLSLRSPERVRAFARLKRDFMQTANCIQPQIEVANRVVALSQSAHIHVVFAEADEVVSAAEHHRKIGALTNVTLWEVDGRNHFLAGAETRVAEIVRALTSEAYGPGYGGHN